MKIERSALVSHSALKMYQLVEDVASYPLFLSWCTAADVQQQTQRMQKASLTVSITGIKQHFTTINSLSAGRRLQMKLLEGPFKDLNGEWVFKQLGEEGSKVSLLLHFEMMSGPVARLFGAGFGKVADRLVDDFCKRADVIY